MSSGKAFPEGLKWVECKRGIIGKNSPVRYIPEQDPVQDSLEKNKKTTNFKLTLPNTGNKLKVAVWVSGTPKQFLLHVRSAIHACKQMGLDTRLADAERAVETAKLNAEIAKREYTQLHNSEKKKRAIKEMRPALHDKALKALEAEKLVVTTAGVKPFELYGNLLSDKARQPWEKIIKAQVTHAPWEDIKGVLHTETPTKTWDSFHECVTFHLLQVFCHDAGEALKYYITNTLKKPNRVSIRQFVFQVEQLNSYLETLSCLYYSLKANHATKKVLPLDDADLTTHLLCMCPAKCQTQYNLTENTTPPKKVGWTEKHCVLYKKHGGSLKSHNTHDCRHYNKDGTPIKRNAGAGKPHSKERKPEGANFTQIVQAELKKALHKKSGKRKKRRTNDSECDSDSGQLVKALVG
eukprot:CCRYP_016107-RA/>CCRYP_016107-RA protein AED:0.23 eAED:0.69 QI:0/0/0/0.66/1/1/3/0/407